MTPSLQVNTLNTPQYWLKQAPEDQCHVTGDVLEKELVSHRLSFPIDPHCNHQHWRKTPPGQPTQNLSSQQVISLNMLLSLLCCTHCWLWPDTHLTSQETQHKSPCHSHGLCHPRVLASSITMDFLKRHHLNYQQQSGPKINQTYPRPWSYLILVPLPL